MSASPALALDAVAFQLAAALEKYEQQVDLMVDRWLDMGRYRDASDQIEEIRMFCAALPQLGAAWVELLIAHAELVHSLWGLRFREDADDRERFEQVRSRHCAAVRSLKAPCLRLLAHRQQPGPAPMPPSSFSDNAS